MNRHTPDAQSPTASAGIAETIKLGRPGERSGLVLASGDDARNFVISRPIPARLR
jgi:hypothetical protein